jgi:hypothetical protein
MIIRSQIISKKMPEFQGIMLIISKKMPEFQGVILLISKKLLKFQGITLLISRKPPELYIYIFNKNASATQLKYMTYINMVAITQTIFFFFFCLCKVQSCLLIKM